MVYKKNTTNNKGFTLVELLVVIAVIGALSTFVIIALGNARSKARDSKRVADVKQLATALELYYADNNTYPPIITPGQPLANPNGGSDYLGKVPSNPTPRTDGDCANSDYIYTVSPNGGWFTISFCTANKIADLDSGALIISPSGIQQANAMEKAIASLEDYRKDQKYYPASLMPGEPLVGPDNKVYIAHVPDLRQGDCQTYQIMGPFCVYPAGRSRRDDPKEGVYNAVFASQEDANNQTNAISYFWTFYSLASNSTMKAGINTMNKNGVYSSAHEWSVTVPEVLAYAQTQGCTVTRNETCENNFINNYVEIRKNWDLSPRGNLRGLNIYKYCYSDSSCLMNLAPWDLMNESQNCKYWKKAGVTQATVWVRSSGHNSIYQFSNDCQVNNVGYR